MSLCQAHFDMYICGKNPKTDKGYQGSLFIWNNREIIFGKNVAAAGESRGTPCISVCNTSAANAPHGKPDRKHLLYDNLPILQNDTLVKRYRTQESRPPCCQCVVF